MEKTCYSSSCEYSLTWGTTLEGRVLAQVETKGRSDVKNVKIQQILFFFPCVHKAIGLLGWILGVRSCGFRSGRFHSRKSNLELPMEMLLRGKKRCIIWSLKQNRGEAVGNFKCSEILLLRDKTALFRSDTELGNKSWCSSHVIALQNGPTDYSLS